MAQSERPFENLPLVLTGRGDTRKKGRRNIPLDPTTASNRKNRSDHASSLRASASSIADCWREQLAERFGSEESVIENGVPLLLQVDQRYDLDDLRGHFEFEVISEHDDGFIIVVSKDLSLQVLRDKLDEFEAASGSSTVAQIHELVDDETQEKRLKRILTDQLFAEWPTMEDDQEYIVDVSIACVGHWQIRKKPKRDRRWKAETWARKISTWANERTEAYIRWDELKDTRLDDINSILSSYEVETLKNWESVDDNSVQLPDSFTVRLRTPGKGLRDLVLNYAWVWEVTEPDDIQTPQQIQRDLQTLTTQLQVNSPPDDSTTVCVIDSGVQENHLLLEPAIRNAESRCFLDSATATDVADYVKPAGHGTRVAGAILYGENIPRSGVVDLGWWIQNARVLDKRCKMPKTMLPAAVIRDVVTHYNRGNNPTRIFNHSINTTSACRTTHMSTWAAEIDKLCHDRDVLVVQSAGDIDRSGSSPNLGVEDHLAAGRSYPDYLSEPTSRIANPAQSLQALTVGSVAYESVTAGGWQSLATQDCEPSGFSRCGEGIWGTIKPEVVEYGGDYLCDGSNPPTVNFPAAGKSAYPNLVSSTLHGQPAVAQDEVGTSFAVPKVTRIAAELANVMPDASCLLYRALIVQSARWPNWAEDLPKPEQIKLLQRIGYGIPDRSRATENTEHRVSFTTTADEFIGPKQSHVYQIPIPDEVRRPGGDYDIRVDVTLSYSAAPRRTRRSPRGYLAVWADWIASKRDEEADAFLKRSLEMDGEVEKERSKELPWVLHPTTQHGLSGVRRDRGTVQKDWAIVKSNAFPENLSIAVRGHQGWSRDPDDTAAYTLAVSFEVVAKR